MKCTTQPFSAGRFAAAVIAVLVASVGLAASQAATLPGAGKTVKPARATWNTGWFQAQVYIDGLKVLGYRVEPPVTLDNPAFYRSVAQGSVDFWVNGWFPLHDTYRNIFEGKAELIGYVAKGGALQGYMVDKKSAEKYHITDLSDFKNKRIDEAFDTNGNGKADLIGCPSGWGCEVTIAYQMDAYKLHPYVQVIKPSQTRFYFQSYDSYMTQAVGRVEAGKPVLFYTWTPNWTVGLLKPGKDVVWIDVPHPALPKSQQKYLDKSTVPNVTGCVSNPCRMGWPANDIRPVVNKEFAESNPVAKKFFELVHIPLKDIFAQNVKMHEGANSQQDIEKQAKQWIHDHQKEWNHWLEEAKRAG